MKNTKQIISSAVIFAGLLVLSAPAQADWRDRYRRHERHEYRENLSDLRAAQQELNRDLRRGASRREIARDRLAIARERQELSQDRRGWWDRGWYGGWWR
jgi:hypothetical protein